jgi:hypothetical protein
VPEPHPHVPNTTRPADGRLVACHRRVVAFMSANQTMPGIAAEPFLLDATPQTAASPS